MVNEYFINKEGNKRIGLYILLFFVFFILGFIITGKLMVADISLLVGCIFFVVYFIALIVFTILAFLHDKKLKNTIFTLETEFEAGNYAFALSMAEKNAKKSDIAAAIAGICYFHGYGCDYDKEKAFKYFSMGKGSNGDAQYYYAYYILEGLVPAKSMHKAVKLLKKSAKNGNELGAFYLGLQQLTGKFVKQDTGEAVKNIRIAAEKNVPEALYLLGTIMYNGKYVKQNQERGIELISQAADAGVQEAIDFLNEISK